MEQQSFPIQDNLNANKRFRIIQELNQLSSRECDVLEELLMYSGAPAGCFPNSNAPVGVRIPSMLNWWESPTGPAQPLEFIVELARIAKVCVYLYSIPSPQFEQILFVLDIPNGIIPGSSAPQVERVKALIQYVFQNGLQSELIEVMKEL